MKRKTNMIIFVDKHLQLSGGDSQIRLVEPIGYVPSHRSEFASLLNQRVEETQAKEKFLKLLCKNKIP